MYHQYTRWTNCAIDRVTHTIFDNIEYQVKYYYTVYILYSITPPHISPVCGRSLNPMDTMMMITWRLRLVYIPPISYVFPISKRVVWIGYAVLHGFGANYDYDEVRAISFAKC